MPSSKEYLDYILEQLSEEDAVTYRAMMGEFILYTHGVVFGGIYDDRLLVKPTPSALALMPQARRELPYVGAKEMLLVEEVENVAFLHNLILAVGGDLSKGKKSKK
ncbi:MAG TPA: competence protein TfoX [Clostridiales bacterium]|nr:competence protein TfoX [Clostridiales bacterium]